MFPDVDANQHLTRNVSLAFGVKTSVFFTNAELTYHVLENVVFSTYGGMDMSTEQKLRNGTGHAFVVADVTRGNEGVKHGRRGGRG